MKLPKEKLTLFPQREIFTFYGRGDHKLILHHLCYWRGQRDTILQIHMFRRFTTSYYTTTHRLNPNEWWNVFTIKPQVQCWVTWMTLIDMIVLFMLCVWQKFPSSQTRTHKTRITIWKCTDLFTFSGLKASVCNIFVTNILNRIAVTTVVFEYVMIMYWETSH